VCGVILPLRLPVLEALEATEVHPKSCTDLACGYCDTLD